MKNLRNVVLCMLAIVFAAAASAATQSPFNGTWNLKAAGSRVENGQRVSFTLMNGKYKCESCTPKFEIEVDGRPHAVKGQQGFNIETARMIDTRTLGFIDSMQGREVHSMTLKVSADGKHLVVDDRYFRNGHEMRETYRMTRTQAGPSGSNFMSGTWQKTAIIRLPTKGRGIKIHIADGYLDINLSNGMHHLKLGGPAESIQPGSTVKMKASLSGPRTLQLDSLMGNKTVMQQTLTVAGDGKSLQLQGHNYLTGMKITMTADRQ